MWIFKRKNSHSSSKSHSRTNSFDSLTSDSLSRRYNCSSLDNQCDLQEYKLRSSWRSSFTDSIQYQKTQEGPLRLLSEINDQLYASDSESSTNISIVSEISAITDITMESQPSFIDEVQNSIKNSTTLDLPKVSNSEFLTCSTIASVCSRKPTVSTLRESAMQSEIALEDSEDSQWSGSEDTITAECPPRNPARYNMGRGIAPLNISTARKNKHAASSDDSIDFDFSEERTDRHPTLNFHENPTYQKNVVVDPSAPSITMSDLKKMMNWNNCKNVQVTQKQGSGEGQTDLANEVADLGILGSLDSKDSLTDQFTSTIERFSFINESMNSSSAMSLNTLLPYIRVNANKSSLPSLYQLGIVESVPNISKEESTVLKSANESKEEKTNSFLQQDKQDLKKKSTFGRAVIKDEHDSPRPIKMVPNKEVSNTFIKKWVHQSQTDVLSPCSGPSSIKYTIPELQHMIGN